MDSCKILCHAQKLTDIHVHVLLILIPQVNREYVLECFIKDNPILRDKISYNFEPSGDDKVTTLSREHEAELYLNKVSQITFV